MLVSLRGDQELNEVKLINALSQSLDQAVLDCRNLTAEDISRQGLEPLPFVSSDRILTMTDSRSTELGHDLPPFHGSDSSGTDTFYLRSQSERPPSRALQLMSSQRMPPSLICAMLSR